MIILFSQFGRKKKKYRGTSTDTKNGEEVKQPVTEEEVEEEEEEGGDMSAYKLDSEEVENKHEMSCVMRNLLFTNTKTQISSADQHLCFCYIDSTIPLLPKSEISSL